MHKTKQYSHLIFISFDKYWYCWKAPLRTDDRFTHDFGDVVDKVVTVVSVHVVVAVLLGVVFYTALDTIGTETTEAGRLPFKLNWTHLTQTWCKEVHQGRVLSYSVTKL